MEKYDTMGNPAEGTPPPRWKQAIVEWMGLIPVLLFLSYLIKWLGVETMWLKLIIEASILVPLLKFVIVPLMDGLFSDWLYRGVDEGQRDKPVSV